MSQKLNDILDSAQPELQALPLPILVGIIVLGVISGSGLLALMCMPLSIPSHKQLWRRMSLAFTILFGVIVIGVQTMVLNTSTLEAQRQTLADYTSKTYGVELPDEMVRLIISESYLTKEREYSFLPTPEEADRLGVSLLSYRVLSDNSIILLGDGDIIQPTN